MPDTDLPDIDPQDLDRAHADGQAVLDRGVDLDDPAQVEALVTQRRIRSTVDDLAASITDGHDGPAG